MAVSDSHVKRLSSPSGFRVLVNENSSIRRMDCGDIAINLFPGNELEGGCTNLYLRRVGATGNATDHIALLGPGSPTRFESRGTDTALRGWGQWGGLRYSIELVLSDSDASWFWHVDVENTGNSAQQIDLVYVQDIALAPYGATRVNEYYVSQYLDHTALTHATHGHVVASRQNQAVAGRYPWSIIGSLQRTTSWSTDALQFHGLAVRANESPIGLTNGLPAQRLQHEHALVGLQDEAVTLAAGARVHRGFFGSFVADHPAATTPVDLAEVERALQMAPVRRADSLEEAGTPSVQSLFTAAPVLAVEALTGADVRALAGDERHDVETSDSGELLSFFHGANHHVVLRAKELIVQRPHGHLLRTGIRPTPDETALTSTTWMNGVFHSMVTQGHVSINRFLSTTRSYLGLFRSHGQRVFVEIEGKWQLLDMPSAFEMSPTRCRWIYKHAGGTIEVRSAASSDPHALTLELSIVHGSATRFLISHHIALNGDDGGISGAADWSRNPDGIAVRPVANSELAQRFPQGDFLIGAASASIDAVGGDELLFVDGQSRQQPYVCIVTVPASDFALRLSGRLVDAADSNSETLRAETQAPLGAGDDVSTLALRIEPLDGTLSEQVARLQHIIPWFIHNALIHYLSPRGLEQYSGGGWGTRDVSQGPVELLLACGHTAPVRDLLLRVFRAQNADGDWPQWFMFFERERNIRAGDSHGDIVFWPLLALAQYLLASGDATLLDERIPFFEDAATQLSVWQHVECSLSLISRRVVDGTALAAYGHGDWNDSLQPADPRMREHMCSAWTVTLHKQMLITLARALRSIGRDDAALPLEENAVSVQKDFQRLLVVDGVLTGYALFDAGGGMTDVRYLLHPQDVTSGVHYSSLAMIHAILEGMLTPAQVTAHLRLIDEQLTGPDGVRLFDQPMAYHGGPQRLFQRAETATFFGREIGLMYMHAHLRYAQALAHLGEADRFFKALCQSNPIGLRDIVPQATRRQANCYYSSSDAAFADRQDASDHYERVVAGQIALDGGWRVYSSGAGIALSLIVRRFLGLSFEAATLELDPVMPSALSGLRVTTLLFGQAVTLMYRVGKAGCGVMSVSINGDALKFERGSNPYRTGSARIDRSQVIARLRQGDNLIEIDLG